MSDFDASILQLHAAIKPLRGLLDLADVLEQARDAQRVIENSASMVADIAARTRAADAREVQARERCAAADAAVEKANAEAAGLIDGAKRDAEAIKAAAAEQAQKITDAAVAAVEAAKAKERRAEADQRKAEAATAAAEKALAEIQGKLADAQAIIAKAEAVRAAMG